MSVHAPHPARTGLLFVCLGNICRSPMAKAIFTHQARRRGVLDRFQIDSCGIGAWHVGAGADPRAVLTAANNGVEVPHRARQVDPATDFQRFELLLAMDRSNRTDLIDLGAPPQRVVLIRSFDSSLVGQPEHELDVPDPYSGSDQGFQVVYDMLWRASEGLLKRMLQPRS